MAEKISEQIVAHLKSGDFQAAASLFMTGQKQGLFPSDNTITSRLVEEIGENATRKLIVAFSHYPCHFCTKGRATCKGCEGHGHVNHDSVCEECLGLGSVRCDFCNGSGWVAIEDMPDGLRSAVVLRRAQTALSRTKSFLGKSPQFSEGNPSKTLKECALALAYLDRYMGVLENVVIVCDRMNAPQGRYRNKIGKTRQQCVEAAVKIRQRIPAVFQHMADAAQREASQADRDSTRQQFAMRSMEFYKSVTAESAALADLRDEHPFLGKAIEKYISERRQTRYGK